MTHRSCSSVRARAPRGLAIACIAVVALPALAQYKVVGPDGKVTYTDRPPVDGRGVTSVNGRSAATATAPADANLPLELRQPVSRYPVTLYTVSGACDPCSAARQLLRQRGVPFSEKQVLSPEDGEALERLSGARDAPTLAIGTQVMRGLAPEVWGSYLDAAGYPRESRLPSGYQYAQPTPIVERREAAAPRNAPTASTPAEPAGSRPVPATGAGPAGIKF